MVTGIMVLGKKKKNWMGSKQDAATGGIGERTKILAGDKATNKQPKM